MKCVACSKEISEQEGFISNVDMQGKETTDPVVACSAECCKKFEKTLPMNGRPVVHISRITGYYQVVENWNKGKQQEFFDRKRYSIE